MFVILAGCTSFFDWWLWSHCWLLPATSDAWMDPKKIRYVKALKTLFDLSALIELSVLFIKGGGLGGKKESGQLRFGGRERPFRAPLCVLGLKFELLCLIISTHYFLSNYFRVSAVPRKFFFTKQLPMTKMLHVFLPKQTPNSICRFTTAWYSTSTWRAIYVTFSGIIFLDLVPTSSDKLFNYHHLLMSFFIIAKF